MQSKQVELEQLIKELMYQHLTVSYTWQWDRAVTRWGRCNHGQKLLTFSKALFMANDIAEARHTILHEIAHANVGKGHGHDRVWRAECVRLGIKASTYHPFNEANKPAPGAKYKGTCPNGHVSYKYRKSRSMGRSSCGQCSSRYEFKYLIKWAAIV